MNLVIASLSNRNLSTLIKSINKSDYENIFIMWEDIYETLDKSYLDGCSILYYKDTVYPYSLETLGVSRDVLDIQTTFKKCLLFSYLFSKGITSFFYTDDDVYFYKKPEYSNDIVFHWMEDSLMTRNLIRNSFYNEWFSNVSCLVSTDRSAIVGNFHINLNQQFIEMYQQYMKDFAITMSSIPLEEWASFRLSKRNSKTFFLDSLFLTNFFKKLFDSGIDHKRNNDYIILSCSRKKLLEGLFNYKIIPKNKVLIHYNISDKDQFFDNFFKE